MLDLGLEHLGVDVGAAGTGVTAVLKACGESAHLESWDVVLPHSSSSPSTALSRLEDPETQCPADKAAALVAAHKDVVGMPLLLGSCSRFLTLSLDGLSRLPPIRLKSEAELENQKTPEASHALNDGKAEPSNPPPIIVSPDSETQINVESPVGIEATAFTASNTSVTPNL